MRLVTADNDNVDGWLMLTRSIRGWLLTASLNAAHFPLGGPIGRLAPEVFRLSDQVFGTDFDDLAPPFGVTTAADRSKKPRSCRTYPR